jgi:hypothetical protein
LLLLFAAWRVWLSAALSAASPLIAAASSVVPVIAIALLSATASAPTAAAFTALTAFVALLLTALVTAPRLRIVVRLLLLLRGSARVAGSVW